MNKETKILIAVLACSALVYLGANYNKNVVTKAPENSNEIHYTTQQLKSDMTQDEFLNKIKGNKEVIDALIDDDNVMNIFVVDDGTSRKGLAIYYCSEASDNKMNVLKTRIYEFDKDNFPHNKRNYGRLLGESSCY